MPTATRKDVAKSIKTLLVVLQSMRGQQVTITLRNDSIVYGTVTKVDSNMNVELRDAVIKLDPFYCTEPATQTSHTGPPADQSTSVEAHEEVKEDLTRDNCRVTRADDAEQSSDSENEDSESPTNEAMPYFLVKGSRIRHIDVPDNFEPVTQARQEIERLRNRTKVWTKRDVVR